MSAMTLSINLSQIQARTAGELVSEVNRRLGHVLNFHPFITRVERTHMTEQKWFRRRVSTTIEGNVVRYDIDNIPMTPDQRRSMISYR